MNNDDFTASVTKHNVTREEIEKFLTENVVKFIFLDKEFADLSSDKTINEIHKFKSKYRGNTFIRVPIKVVKKEEDKYATGIEVDTSDNSQGFAVISKHDIWGLSNDMKKKSAEQRIEIGKRMCLKAINKLNKMLSNNVFRLVVTNENDNVVDDRLLYCGSDFDDLDENVSCVIEELKKKESSNVLI